MAIIAGIVPEGLSHSATQGGFFGNGKVVWTQRQEWLAPKFTASLDAALTLMERVLPGTHWHVQTTGEPNSGRFSAEVWRDANAKAIEYEAKTPALALLAAMLTALGPSAHDTSERSDQTRDEP